MANTNIIDGTQGSVSLPTGHNAKIGNFSVRMSYAGMDVTGFDSNGWQEMIATLKGLSGSASGRMKRGVPNSTPGIVAGAKEGAQMTLTFANGCTLSFNAVLSDIAIDEDARGEASISFNFASTGEVTANWDEVGGGGGG